MPQDTGVAGRARHDRAHGAERWRPRGGPGPLNRREGGPRLPGFPPAHLLATTVGGFSIAQAAIVAAMSLDPRVDIGHVHLKVADIDRSLGFYRGVLGFDADAA